MNKINKIYFLKIIALSGLLFFCLFLFETKTSKAALGTAACNAKGGSCDFTCISSDYESLGDCDYGVKICCRKKLVDTSGADPDPTGGIGGAAGGTVTPGTSGIVDPNSGLGGAAGGTVAPGTSGLPTNSTGVVSPTNSANSATGAASPAGALVPCGIGAGNANCTLCHLVLGFKNIYDYLLVLLLSATTLVIVVAGVMYMVSSGDKGMIDKAKSALTYALTAMILALVAWLIINATLSALGYTKVGSWYNFTCDTAQTQGPTGGTGTGTLPGNTGFGNTGGTGCAAVVANINSMAGSAYGPGNDCSATTNRAYTNAGCKSPGSDSAAMYANASQFTGAVNLKAGDVLVRNGHVGICLVDGCAQIMGASTAGGIHPSSGSSMINNPSVRVIKASDYCPASSC